MWISLFQQMRINPLKLNRKTNLFRQIRLLRFLIKCKVLRSDFQEQKGNFYTLLFSYLYLFSFFPFSSFCRPHLQGDYGKPCSFGYTGNYALQAYAIFVCLHAIQPRRCRLHTTLTRSTAPWRKLS